MPEFTPTEKRIMDVVRDGERHTKDELEACLDDEMAEPYILPQHVTRINKKLNPVGLNLACLVKGRTRSYRLMRLIRSYNDE